jgi:hypothetical protein
MSFKSSHNRPTRGIPLSDAERRYSRDGKWKAGPRFVWVSHFGSASSNTGVHKPGKSKPATPPPRLTLVPRWARKYL